MKETSNDSGKPAVTQRMPTPVLGQQQFCPHYVNIFETPAASPESAQKVARPRAANDRSERPVRLAESVTHTDDELLVGEREPVVAVEAT